MLHTRGINRFPKIGAGLIETHECTLFRNPDPSRIFEPIKKDKKDIPGE